MWFEYKEIRFKMNMWHDLIDSAFFNVENQCYGGHIIITLKLIICIIEMSIYFNLRYPWVRLGLEI